MRAWWYVHASVLVGARVRIGACVVQTQTHSTRSGSAGAANVETSTYCAAHVETSIYCAAHVETNTYCAAHVETNDYMLIVQPMLDQASFRTKWQRTQTTPACMRLSHPAHSGKLAATVATQLVLPQLPPSVTTAPLKLKRCRRKPAGRTPNFPHTEMSTPHFFTDKLEGGEGVTALAAVHGIDRMFDRHRVTTHRQRL
jgi:hypothetical protein